MKKNYLKLASKSAQLQINELKKIKKVFNESFISLALLQERYQLLFLAWEYQVFFVIQLKHYMEIWGNLKKKIF